MLAAGAWAFVVLAQAPSDPLFPHQWHLKNTGQGGGTAGADINVEPVWTEFRGSPNEVVAVVDDGLEIGHEDLAANVIAGVSYNYVDGTSDPTPVETSDSHGTSVAGVAAARGFNGLGVAGVAPAAGLVGFNFLQNQLLSNETDALSRSNQVVDIYSNSWGPADGGYSFGPMPAVVEATLASGVRNGRNGLGSVYVWAAGNGYGADNSNYDGYANSRYVIAVSASTNTGAHAVYSEPGANILVNAPSNGGTLGIMTTDLGGAAGCNPGTVLPGCGPNPIADQNYTAFFGGTSSAAPAVSGVVALMLEANPALGWRDVREILAVTADQNSPNDGSWTSNGAGFHVSHTLGFGRVNAQAAVAAARTWTNLGTEVSASGSAAPAAPIPDAPGFNVFGPPVESTVEIADNIRVESAEVVFTSHDHTYWGDLEIVLRSPAGTESILAESHASDPGPYNAWKFSSARHLGELALGAWTLTVRDGGPQDVGTFDSWTLRVYGVRAETRIPVTVSITGTGHVTSDPPGLDCDSTCSVPFHAGTSVTLSPVPGPGMVFGGWRGEADCLDGSITVAQATTCTAAFSPIAPPLPPRAIDLNGDNSADVLLYNPSSGGVTSALGDRAGAFSFTTRVWEPGWVVTPARLNDDGLTDFFLYNPVTGEWRQALATGTGDFAFTQGTFSPGWQVWAGPFRAGSLDDVFVYNRERGGAFHCLVDGHGGFVSYHYQPWIAGWDLRLGDFDGDALADVFAYNPASGHWVTCLNRGPGAYLLRFGTWSPAWTLTVGNFDGNSTDDLFVYNETDGRWYTCLSVGDGGFTYFGGSWSPGWRVYRARLDFDAFDDLFVYSPRTGVWYQCFSGGLGGFRSYIGDFWSASWELAVTDLDHDGLDDVFVYSAARGEYFQCLTATSGHFKLYLRGYAEPASRVIANSYR